MHAFLRLAGIRRAGVVWLVVAWSTAALAQERPTFRSSTDLIAVDVQVVSSAGTPILGLTPDRFTVSINGKRRKVVSLQLLNYDAGASRTATGGGATSDPSMAPAPPPGRVFVLAIDVLSFQPEATRAIAEAAMGFLDGLNPDDAVGVYAFPSGPQVEPTTDRDPVVAALKTITGTGDSPGGVGNRFQLSPSTIADLTAVREREPYVDPRDPPPNSETGRKVREICAYDRDETQCRFEVVVAAQMLAMYEEGVIVQRLGAFRGVLDALATDPRRKTVVLVSTGIFASDIPGGRPDIGDLGLLIGQEAARSNSSVYTLHVDTQRMGLTSAASGRSPRPTDNPTRDSALMGGSLGRIAGASGGSAFTVVQGGGEPAFKRVLTETSSVYLLAVEPDAADRDNQPKRLTVNVNTGQRGTTVRSRSWVVIPSTTVVASRNTASGTPAAPRLREPTMIEPTSEDKAAWDRLWASRTVPRTPTEFDALYDAYAAGDTSVVVRSLYAPGGFERYRPYMAASLNDWRTEWSPRRAAFALEVALIAIAQGRPNAHQFLTSAQRIVTSRPEAPGVRPEDDAFEVLFHRTALAILAALDAPRAIDAYLQSIADRLGLGAGGPLADPRLELAAAVAEEVQTLPLYTAAGARSGSRVWSWTAGVNDDDGRERLKRVLTLLNAAARDVATRPESLVRRAFVLHRLGAHADAVVLLDLADTSHDPVVAYWHQLVRGRVLKALGRHDEAIAAYEQAAALTPGAQTPAVALAALLIATGDHEGAARQATAARSTTEDNIDPWPQYWTGDARFLAGWLDELRQARP